MKSDINLWAAVDGTSENVYALVKAASAEEAAAIAEEAQKRGSGSHGTDMYLPVTRDAVKSLGRASMLDSQEDYAEKQHTLKIVKKFMKSSSQVVDFNEVGILTFPDLDTYAYGSVDESAIQETVYSNQRFKKLAGLLKEQVEMPDEEGEAKTSGNFFTVGDLKKLIAGLPDDMPVVTDHEFGMMNASAEIEKDYYYKPTKWGGSWHYHKDEGDGPYEVLAIESY